MVLISVQTKGHYDFIDITKKVEKIVIDSKIKEGIALVFVKGSTAAMTTMEYESGLIGDLKNVFEKLAPEKADYQHHLRWGDHNGAAHIKSAIIGTDLAIPIENGKLILGQWQQIVLIDFDERPRQREIIVKVIKS
ncbi:secondary thiamine-phosphate synthase enzyme YjbQ [Candidatus Parcubacteria bacterium]|nr:secondary thiamine-phosphate synthase enzyme YjbQ [Candidatus Parcubacteria bacterium]